MGMLNFRLAAITIIAILQLSCMLPADVTIWDVPKDRPAFDWAHARIDMPKPGCMVKTSLPHPDINAIDFYLIRPVPLGPINVYSLEWTHMHDNPQKTDDEFYEYWAEFLPNYLSKNFGNGHFSLLYQARSRFNDKYPALYYVGSGVHDSGRKGSIYGIVVGMGHHMGAMYALKGTPISKDLLPLQSPDSVRQLPEYSHFEKWALSLKYTGKEKALRHFKEQNSEAP